ncbi:hypothetical protein [Pseudomonas sp. DR48]|uniref:hypothetical protein n=1 Tax=Pseudomonas sp. DR48 TaxID=2871095 RepID=UPI001C9A1E20|nr:hypothetical protein [Pseudomonas sp. DR48]QZP30720.1 hypothetical protein K5K95_21285 [Pseudomonas sp. DR48]
MGRIYFLSLKINPSPFHILKINPSPFFKGHPAENDAFSGKVTPGKIDGVVNPDDHNYGGHSGDSPYTSWTRSPDIARQFAKEDGLILRVKIGAPKEGDKWSWQYSEDRWGGSKKFS